VLPFEWVSRPAAAPIRGYIDANGWCVEVYRLCDGVFPDVLTVPSITIIDKQGPSGWRFHEIDADGGVKDLASPTGTVAGVLAYTRVCDDKTPRAKRGLSPGTQQVLTLSEGERVHAGLHVRRDVVRCVTSLRPIPPKLVHLTPAAFDQYLVATGAKCWLIRTNREPSARLQGYLESIDESRYQTSTCLGREQWWQFLMPQQVPRLLIAQAFKGATPKAVVNDVQAHAVGGVAGVYNISTAAGVRLIEELAAQNLHDRLVPYAKQMRKLEINQINSLLISMHCVGCDA
jgi:hypothetical protein